MVIVRNKKYLEWNKNSKKQFDKIMNKTCKLCKRKFGDAGGISAYDSICKECADNL